MINRNDNIHEGLEKLASFRAGLKIKNMPIAPPNMRTVKPIGLKPLPRRLEAAALKKTQLAKKRKSGLKSILGI